MTDLISEFLDVGLFQFGAFTVNGVEQPFVHHLEMLPAYPRLLSAVGKEIAAQLRDHEFSHVLCAPDAIPLGTVVSLELSKSLVFPSADGTALIGAHDIGHPTVLIVNYIQNDDSIAGLIRQSHRVGLEIKQITGLLGNPEAIKIESVQVATLIKIVEIVEVAATTRRIPVGHVDATQRWVQANSM